MAAAIQTTFDDHALHAVARRQAQIIIGGGILLAILAVALALTAIKPKVSVPVYVVAVDAKSGEVLGTGHPVAASPAQSTAITRQVIERWIEDSRGISNNIDLERDRLNHVYAIARGQALKAIDQWYHLDDAHNAMHAALDGKWTEVEIVRCLRQPEPETWLIEWREAAHTPNSSVVHTSDWQASIRTATTEDGIFIINADWQKSADEGGSH